MAAFGEGTIEIPMEDFWEFVNKYHEHKKAELAFGVPKVNHLNNTININYAFGNDSDPREWSEEPTAVKEWKVYKKSPQEGLVDGNYYWVRQHIGSEWVIAAYYNEPKRGDKFSIDGELVDVYIVDKKPIIKN